MADIKSQPYAEWLEASLRELVELHPQSIGIITILPDGSTGTQYYNCDNRDRLIMCEALQLDEHEVDMTEEEIDAAFVEAWNRRANDV